MRKIVLSLLGVIFISGYINNLFGSDKSILSYLFFLIGFGLIIIYVLNKVISQRILTYCQIVFICINFISISGLYIYGFTNSNNSFGLALMVMMLFTILFAQIVVFSAHLCINKLKYDNRKLVENNIVIGYTFIFFVFNQMSIPNHYYIPFLTWITIYSIVFLLFGGLSLLIIKGFKKDMYLLLVISLISLMIVQNSGVDVNIFLRLPFQIIVMILLLIKFIPLNFKSYNVKT